ncbi:MAG: hypothetical protein IJ133_06600, partial [Clostridia bacterium]|nr:hypothetical protein [Clostridia bacterium]
LPGAAAMKVPEKTVSGKNSKNYFAYSFDWGKKTLTIESNGDPDVSPYLPFLNPADPNAQNIILKAPAKVVGLGFHELITSGKINKIVGKTVEYSRLKSGRYTERDEITVNISYALNAKGQPAQCNYTNHTKAALYKTGRSNQVDSQASDLVGKITYAYDAKGRIAKITCTQEDYSQGVSQDSVMTFGYDANDKMNLLKVRTKDKLSNAGSVVTEDASCFKDGRLVRSPESKETYTYDAKGRLITSVAKGFRTTIRTYGADGYLTRVTYQADYNKALDYYQKQNKRTMSADDQKALKKYIDSYNDSYTVQYAAKGVQ